MRIAYLSCDFGVPVFGTTGSAVHLRELVRALRGLGQEVRVYSPAADEGGAPNAIDGVQIVSLGGIAHEVAELLKREDTGLPEHLYREWRRLLFAEHAQRELRPLLEAFAPDAIYERYALFSYAGVELAQALGVPLVLEVNAPLAQEAATHRELVLRATAEALEQRILCAASAVVVVSEPLAGHARRLGVAPERIEVLPNGVDPERFHPDVSGEAVRARHGLEGKRVVGFAGSLKPWHDIDTLVAAARLLHERDERVRLLIVGDGPGMAPLRALDAPFLVLTGAVRHEDVAAHYAAMDAIAVTFTGESDYFSPVKLFEAMAMAKPVVAARAGQIAQLVVDGETGLLYEPGDASDLAVKVRDAFAREDGGASLGAAARSYVLDGHTWEHNARRVTEIVASLKGGGV